MSTKAAVKRLVPCAKLYLAEAPGESYTNVRNQNSPSVRLS